MPLLDILGVEAPQDIDPNRGLKIISKYFGAEAAAEAVRIIESGPIFTAFHQYKFDVRAPMHITVSRQGNVIGELFGHPKNHTGPFPTAIEISLVRALDHCDKDNAQSIIEGGSLLLISIDHSISKVQNLIESIGARMGLESELWYSNTTLNLSRSNDELLTDPASKCLLASFEIMPVKYKFLELYRVFETRFLRDTLETLNYEFFRQPLMAVEAARERIKNELMQVVSVAEFRPDYFAILKNKIDELIVSNRFAAALHRKLQRGSPENKSSITRSGASYFYYIRCAIVHAGEKDLVYESYEDAGELMTVIIPTVELAALSTCGLDFT